MRKFTWITCILLAAFSLAFGQDAEKASTPATTEAAKAAAAKAEAEKAEAAKAEAAMPAGSSFNASAAATASPAALGLVETRGRTLSRDATFEVSKGIEAGPDDLKITFDMLEPDSDKVRKPRVVEADTDAKDPVVA
jgi:hypothetical protein